MSLVQLSGPLDTRAIRRIGQLLLRFQMFIDHRLRKLLDPRILRFLEGHMSELDLGHVGHRGLQHEVVFAGDAVADVAGAGCGVRLEDEPCALTIPSPTTTEKIPADERVALKLDFISAPATAELGQRQLVLCKHRSTIAAMSQPRSHGATRVVVSFREIEEAIESRVPGKPCTQARA